MHDASDSHLESAVTLEAKNLFAHAKIAKECLDCQGRLFLLQHDQKNRTIAVPCSCLDLRKKIALFNNAEIPSQYYLATLNNFQSIGLPKIGTAIKLVRRKLKEYQPPTTTNNHNNIKGMLLYGKPGTGKTRLMCALLRELTLKLGVPARFIEFVQLLNQIKRGYDMGDAESEFLLPLVNVDVLVIDELGKGRKSEWESSILDQIVSKRYFARKTTFFTTNYNINHPRPKKAVTESKEEFAPLFERVGSRIYSRIYEMCDFVDMDMADFRVYPTEIVELAKS